MVELALGISEYECDPSCGYLNTYGPANLYFL